MRKTLLSLAVFAIAFAILSISFFRKDMPFQVLAANNLAPTSPLILGVAVPVIDYSLVYPGKILPDSPFWPIKAIRDRIIYLVERNPLKKAEIALLFADKRLSAGKILLENKRPDLGVSTIIKGEKYLDMAFNNAKEAEGKGIDTTSFISKLLLASLKHRQTINEILPMVPDDAKPTVIKNEDYSKNVYKLCKDMLNSRGIYQPKSPFDGQ